jgi:4-amino-4-deoxy-L-arabinose transferase-like glycosyltransferase
VQTQGVPATAASRRRLATRLASPPLILSAIVVLAFALRADSYLEAPRPIEGAGLVAGQGELARNIVEHGKWFVANRAAFDAIATQQSEEGHLIDPSDFDYSRFDTNPSYSPEVNQMPGVAVVLAGLWWLGGTNTYSSLQWLQILLDTGMVLLIYWIALRFGCGRGVAATAGFLYAIWPGAIVVVKRPMLDTWAGFFTIWLLAAFLLARGRPHERRWLVLLGLLTGVGIYFRPFLFFLPILLALLATPGGGWRRRFAWVALPSLVALCVLAPWTIRNYAEFHRFIPTRAGLGYALYEGIGKASSDRDATAYVQKHRPGLKGLAPESDSFLLRSAFDTIRSHPLRYLHLIARRLVYLLPCLLVIVVWRRWRDGGLMLLAVAVATIVPFIPIGGDTRFYLPAAFAYLILLTMVGAIFASTVTRALASTAVFRARRRLSRPDDPTRYKDEGISRRPS